jgi:hypothetical protein
MPKRQPASKRSEKVDTEETMFMVKDQIREEETNVRRGLKTSDEIKIFDVGETNVMDYEQFEKEEAIDYDENDPSIMELDPDTVKKFDISTAKTVEIDGKSERDDLKKETKADFKGLKKRKLDTKKMFHDIKRNIDEYKLICRFCRTSMKCHKCGGRGKVKLILKCQECGGTGMCSHCGERDNIPCPSCEKELSIYATHCTDCGAAFSCPGCFSPIPSTATRCLNCRTEFVCQKCKGIVVPGLDETCRRCGTRDWYKRPKQELPLRKLEKEQAMKAR